MPKIAALFAVVFLAVGCEPAPTTFMAGGTSMRAVAHEQKRSELLDPNRPVTLVGGRLEGRFNGLALDAPAAEHSLSADDFGAYGVLIGHGEPVGVGMGLVNVEGRLQDLEPEKVYTNEVDPIDAAAPVDDTNDNEPTPSDDTNDPNEPQRVVVIPRVTVVECTNPQAVVGDEGWTTDEQTNDASLTLSAPQPGAPTGTLAELRVVGHLGGAASPQRDIQLRFFLSQ